MKLFEIISDHMVTPKMRVQIDREFRDVFKGEGHLTIKTIAETRFEDRKVFLTASVYTRGLIKKGDAAEDEELLFTIISNQAKKIFKAHGFRLVELKRSWDADDLPQYRQAVIRYEIEEIE